MLSVLAANALGAAQQQAYGKLSVLQAPGFSTNFPIPAAGDLHKLYSPLPANDTGCEVLLKVAFSSVNPSDIHPTMAPSGHFPKPMGSDVAGTVVATAGPCKRLKQGDQVWGDIGANAQVAGSGARTKELGAYAQFATALEGQLSRAPAGMGLAEAGSLPKVALTSYKALSWYARFGSRPNGTRVLVLGGSAGTGSVAIQLAKRGFGISTNVTTTTSAANFEYVASLGADTLIDYHTSDWWSVLPDGSMDVVYDCVGESGTGDRAVAKLRAGGSYVTITGELASAELPPQTEQHMFINSDTNLASAPLLEELARLAVVGAVRMPRIDSTFSLEAMDGAFNRSSTHHAVGKISIAVPQPSRETEAAAREAWRR